MKQRIFLSILLFMVGVSAPSISNDFKIIKEVKIDLEDYAETENMGGRVSELIYSELDSSYYVLLNTYPKEMYDKMNWHASQPWLLKLNKDLEVDWVQKDFFETDTLGNFYVFEINQDGSIMAVMAYQLYDSLHISLPYLNIKKFNLNASGAIVSSELSGGGEYSDTTVTYRHLGSGWNYKAGDPQKINGMFYLKSFEKGSNTSIDTYEYIDLFNPDKLLITKDSTSMIALNHQLHLFNILGNGNLLSFTKIWFYLNYNPQCFVFYDSNFERMYSSLEEIKRYDTLSKFLGRQSCGELIKAVTLQPALPDSSMNFNIHEFDSYDGSYLGLDRTVKYNINWTQPTLHFNDDGKLFGTVVPTNYIIDTLEGGAIKKTPLQTFYFLYERELGVMDTFAIEQAEGYNELSRVVQCKKNEYVVAGNIFKYPEIYVGGYIYLAKIDTEAPSSVVDAEVDIKGHLKYLWIYNSYPNPAKGKITLSFFCTPRYLDEVEIAIYDEMGREFENRSFEVLTYNSYRGLGTMTVDLTGIPQGPKYVMLKVKDDSFTKCIMVE